MKVAGPGRDLVPSSRGEMAVALSGVVAAGMELLGQNQEVWQYTWQGVLTSWVDGVGRCF